MGVIFPKDDTPVQIKPTFFEAEYLIISLDYLTEYTKFLSESALRGGLGQ